MSLTEGAVRSAVCTNVADCKKAADGELLEWYPGAGEYCPECGEVLAVRAEAPAPPPASKTPSADILDARPPGPRTPVAETDAGAEAARRARRATGAPNPMFWVWVVAGVLIAVAVAVYAGRRMAVNRASSSVDVCAIPSAQQLAKDLMRAYAVKSGAPAGSFVLITGGSCDARFSTAALSPDAVIARDGIVAIVNPLNPIVRISESQLRALYSGRIRDWSQLGGPRGAIVPLLPDAASDEAKVLGSSLFFGVPIDPGVGRRGSSADVTRLVTGADSISRRAIGVVAFSQSVAAKVVPFTYLPAPNVLSIASGRYPFTLSIALQPESGTNAAAAGFIDFARSRDGAAIVLKNGLIPREGL